VGKLLRELVKPGGGGGDQGGAPSFSAVRTCLAIMQTSVGEELGEAFDQVGDRLIYVLLHSRGFKSKFAVEPDGVLGLGQQDYRASRTQILEWGSCPLPSAC
jgi:hypothetical protein